MTQVSAAGEQARFIAQLRFEDLPAEVVQQAKRVLLDAVGCALGAYAEDPRKVAIAQTVAAGFAGSATVIGGGQAHPAFAALANGMLINAADNDDTHKRALLHVGSVVVPAALAAAQANRASGKDLILALVVGYEVAVRVGQAVMPTHYRFWHSTATNGTFGAAAAVAKALGLNQAQIQTAIGYAGTQAAGLNTFFESGDDSKSVHPGKAALNGYLAAVFAQAGATSPPDILLHPKGYLAAYSTDPKPDALTDRLGTFWEILQNGFKLYPSILASHSPIGATLELVQAQAIDPRQIKSVTVNTYATVKSHFSNKDVQTVMSARLSVPYCVAVAIVDRSVGQPQFRADRFNDPLVREVLHKVEIVPSEALTKLYPEKFPAHVVITMQDGQVHEATFYYPKGDPNNPLSDEELRIKFRTNAAGCFETARTEALMQAIDRLEQGSVKALTDVLGQA